MTALVYEIIYVWVAAMGLISFIFPRIGIEVTSIPAVLTVLALSALVPAFKRSGWTVRLIIVGIFIALSVAGVFLFRNDTIREFLYGYREYIYLPPVAFGAVAIGEVLVYIRVFRIPVSVLLIAYMIFAAVKNIPANKPMILCAASMIVITIIEEMQRSWKKAGDTDNKKHLVNVFFFVMVSLSLMISCPAPEDPYDWQFVKNIANAAYELFMDIQRKLTPEGIYDPANASIGFSGRGEILGSLAHQQDEVLELNELSTGVKYLKLSGKTFDTFDGRSWQSTDPSGGDDVLTDTVAFLASVSEYAEEPGDYARRSSLKIDYLVLESEYVFAPLKSFVDPSGFEAGPVDFTGGDMKWKGDKPEEYYVSFYRINDGNPMFMEFLKGVTVPSEESYNLQLESQYEPVENAPTYEDYLAYLSHVKEYYLQAPVLSDELRAYMDEVYEGCEDDIDKAERLCAFLKSFEYTNNPGELPEYVTDPSSLLDYIILESRRGYCTHFATAFVLLARAEGIPARFVQGYYVPTGGAQNVTVYTSMAHAWPEIYVDGAGWIAFEPTPGYSAGSYWYTNEQAEEAYGNIGAGYVGYQVPEEPENSEEILSEEEETEKTHIPWYVIVIPAASGLLFVALFILAGNVLVSFSFARKGDEEKYKVLCRQIFGLLGILGMGTHAGETLREYGERISADAGDEISAFIGNLTMYLYAGGDDHKAYEKQALDYRNALLKRIRRERPAKFLIYYLGFQKVKNGKTVDNA